ncbi:uncharacterized protein LOC134831350 [Culicoides brevitarsis]|uniref:uncharacterized protein LOC134831350 n=1 Tax=Culicoides brevitarsis TaxID=469753 RepID=UPI00307C61C7
MSESENIYCVCRLCLTEDKVSNLKNMFNFSIKCNEQDDKLTSVTFVQLYLDYTGIPLVHNQDISPYCCTKCETAMIIAFNFRKAVRESNEFLNHILNKIQNFEETDDASDPEKAEKVSQLKSKVFSQIYCRFCYLESDSLSNIYEATYKSTKLFDIFKIVADFVPAQNGLSDMMCKSCETQMTTQIYEGRMSARKNDAYLKKSLETALQAIKEGKLDIEKYKIERDAVDEIVNSEVAEMPLIEPEFIKLEPLEPEIKEEVEDVPDDVMLFD